MIAVPIAAVVALENHFSSQTLTDLQCNVADELRDSVERERKFCINEMKVLI